MHESFDDLKHVLQAGVVVAECDDELVERVEVGGDYGEHECGLTVFNMTDEDAGDWTCEMEEYQFGHWVTGATDEASLHLTLLSNKTVTKIDETVDDDETKANISSLDSNKMEKKTSREDISSSHDDLVSIATQLENIRLDLTDDDTVVQDTFISISTQEKDESEKVIFW